MHFRHAGHQKATENKIMEMNLWKVVCVVCALFLNATGRCKESAGPDKYYI